MTTKPRTARAKRATATASDQVEEKKVESESAETVTPPATKPGDAASDQVEEKKVETESAETVTPPATKPGDAASDQVEEKKVEAESSETVTPPATKPGDAASDQVEEKKVEAESSESAAVSETKAESAELQVTVQATRALVLVTGPKAGRRRIGRAFGPEPVAIPADELTEDQMTALRADPMLTVAVIDAA